MALTLQTAVHGAPSAPAVIIPSKPTPTTISYATLLRDVAALQAQLAGLGIGAGAAVSIATPNSYEFVVAFLAAAWQRAVAAPLNPAYTQAEFEFYIADVKSAVVLVPRGAHGADAPAVRAARKFRAAVAECWFDARAGRVVLDVKEPGKLQQQQQEKVLTARAEDVALVLHTSGTTSRPKVVPLTHANLTRTMHNITQTYALGPSDRTMLVMPLFHVHGLLCGLLAPLHSGGSLVLPPKFSATDFWADFVRHGATWYTAVPTMHQILLRHPAPRPLPPIRFVRSCSSPLSPAVFAQLEERFGAPVLEAYAMTEAAHQMTSNPLPPGARKPGSVGVGQGVEVVILDEAREAPVPQGRVGEICIKGSNVTAGYLNNAEANASAFTQSGYFRTGDQGRMDAEGYVFITGRIKELINKGGEKISPIELDNVLTRHPAVAEAVSFAVPDEMLGQEVGVAVVLKGGAALGEDELRRWMGERVARFKVPKKVSTSYRSIRLGCDSGVCTEYNQADCAPQIYFTEVMPKTATGKIQRRIVAETMQKQDAKAKL
jgi:acyl-CoA synthetase (AMP-forming)/AMP-acid ligase II